MSFKSAVLTMTILCIVSAVSALAQGSLGDMVVEGGYDWMIDKWAAVIDGENKLELEYKWGLDKHIILVDSSINNFKIHGMIVFVASRDEIIQVSADNQGGFSEGIWTDEYGDAVLRMKRTLANGESLKGEGVYTRVDADTMKVTIHATDSEGNRTDPPPIIYKRQKGDSVSGGATAPTSSGSYQDNLGNLMAQYGYEWMIGKWLGRDERNLDSHLTFAWGLDKHAVFVDMEMGQIKYHAMINFVASRGEVIQIGADNRGGYWKGTWTEDYEGAANRQEMLRADGTTAKMEHVYVRVDGNSLNLKQYDIDDSGYRASSPRGELTYKRQKTDTPSK
jgi:hypothetical protein